MGDETSLTKVNRDPIEDKANLMSHRLFNEGFWVSQR